MEAASARLHRVYNEIESAQDVDAALRLFQAAYPAEFRQNLRHVSISRCVT
jgi:hypothetical protein